MTTAQIQIHDVLTGEIVLREMTADELAQVEKDKTQRQVDAAAQTAKQAARQAVLDKLGLTADEAAALLG
tara:strand:- start:67 stop:276 length:210 start_codon:yes stop_codon:yes gene_type:complete